MFRYTLVYAVEYAYIAFVGKQICEIRAADLSRNKPLYIFHEPPKTKFRNNIEVTPQNK
jgi:hypothetical protein